MPPGNQSVQTASTQSHAGNTPLVAIAVTLLFAAVALFALYYGGFIHFTSTSSITKETVEDDIQNTLATGVYALMGRAGGQTGTYAGTVTITKRLNTENVYDLVWNITSGQVQSGVGILHNNILSVGYIEFIEESAQDAGVVSYVIVDTTRLDGQWTSVQGGTAGVEQLTWQPQL